MTREDVLAAKRAYPHYNRYQLAAVLGVSEQTVQRRLEHNNVRGGKYATQTRVRLVGGLVEQWGTQAGFYLYDRRVWAKDPAWENGRWHSSSYRSVDEFEYLYVFWKPGITTVDRQRLSPDEWQAWGSRGVWHIPSVRANDDHPAKFPSELARRVVRLFSAPGEAVLDCFVGSGTTPVAAIREGRQYLGIDLLPEYVALAKHNCHRAAEQRLAPAGGDAVEVDRRSAEATARPGAAELRQQRCRLARRRLVQEHVGGANLVRRVGIAARGQRQSVLLRKRGGPPVVARKRHARVDHLNRVHQLRHAPQRRLTASASRAAGRAGGAR